MSGNYGQLTVNPSTGAYTYTPNTASINNLAANQSATDTFTLYASDGSLRSTQNFIIQITGAGNGSSSGDQPITSTITSTIPPNDTDHSDASPSALIRNNDGSGFRVTGNSGVWVQLEVLRSNSRWQNSLQIVNSDGHTLGAIGATKHSTNTGNNEIFLSGGSEIRFHQASHNQQLNQSPNLLINPDIDNSFLLHLEDSLDQDGDYDDLSVKITTSQQSKNINAFKLASEQRHINDPILNLTDLQTGTTKLRLTLNSDCGDTNRVAFVKLAGDQTNGFSVDGVASTAGSAFEEAVRDSLINPDNTEILMTGKKTRHIEWTLDQTDGGFYAPVFINQDTNNLVTYGIAKSLKGEHYVKNLGGNFFGYEDLLSSQNPDWDFNDITMLVEMI
jgi:VCBS repeat-containing protein